MKKLKKAPRVRRQYALGASVVDIAKRLSAEPGEWFGLVEGRLEDRVSINTAAYWLRSGRYRTLKEYYERGKFEVTVETDGEHVSAYARFVERKK